ncbi:hypothetical protein BVX97_01390 [bacterium E08(2017)]|nr:hypothetical protein BVX97_01390 [bacterium E08(2017)]
MCRIISLYKTIVLSACMLILVGCATTQVEKMEIKVVSGGRIIVSGRPVSLEEIGASVKRAGASSGTMISIKVPESVSNSLCQSIKRSLANSGFPNLYFVREKRARAYVNKGTDPSGLKKPKPTVPKIRRK